MAQSAKYLRYNKAGTSYANALYTASTDVVNGKMRAHDGTVACWAECVNLTDGETADNVSHLRIVGPDNKIYGVCATSRVRSFTSIIQAGSGSTNATAPISGVTVYSHRFTYNSAVNVRAYRYYAGTDNFATSRTWMAYKLNSSSTWIYIPASMGGSGYISACDLTLAPGSYDFISYRYGDAYGSAWTDIRRA